MPLWQGVRGVDGNFGGSGLQPHERLACFFRAMIAFECPFGNSELPRNMHNTIKSGVKLKLVWLERGHTKADIVADVLATAGFPDFGDQLKLLATSSLQKTHKLA